MTNKVPPKTYEHINSFYGKSKLTKQASKAQRKPSETLLAYLETFGRWVPQTVYSTTDEMAINRAMDDTGEM